MKLNICIVDLQYVPQMELINHKSLFKKLYILINPP